jgi:exodeoxyribonuclease-3
MPTPFRVGIFCLFKFSRSAYRTAMPTKLISWNVNGIRACGKAGFLDWFEEQAADVVCIQESKAQAVQLVPELLNPHGYHSFFHSAEKPGYSGVGIFSKREPLRVNYGIGRPEIDREGRVMLAEYSNFIIINSYFPNSQRDHARLDYKLYFCDKFLKFCESEKKRGKALLICGDLNIAHNEIDLKNPKTNTKNAGFLPQERAWMTKFLGTGYVDTFRHFNDQPEHYTWWSYRPGVRARNIGWRLDYFLTDSDSTSRLRSSIHQTKVFGSDHCPIVSTIQS